MSELPVYPFFIVSRDREAKMRYEGLFVPRVGDTIAISGFYLKVVDVVVESAQNGGLGAQHALYVHVQERNISFDASEFTEFEFDEFCNLLRAEGGGEA